MPRWTIPFIAALMLLSGQTVLAAQPAQGVVRDLADANNARCHNPEGITASPNGLLYAAGLSGNICIYDLSGNELGHLTVAPNHALLGELYTPEGIYVADNNPGFTGGRLIRVDPATGAFVVLAEGFGAPNAIAQDHRGTLYVSDSFAGAIYTVSPNGGGKTLWKADVLLQPHGNPPFGANGVAFDRTQSFLYVANTADDRILRIAVNKDGSAGGVTIFADAATVVNSAGTAAPLDGPDGIQFDVEGNLWLCANQPSADEIQVLSSSAELISAYGRNAGDAPMQTPASLIFHERGLYIANLAFFDPGVGKISVLGVPVAGAPIAH